MFVLIDFLLLLAATYFLSRKLGRSGWFTEKWTGLWAVHAVTAIAVALVALAIKQLFAGLTPLGLALVPAAEAVWLVFDLMRKRTPARLD